MGEVSSGMNTPMNPHPSSDIMVGAEESRQSTPLSNNAAASLLTLNSQLNN